MTKNCIINKKKKIKEAIKLLDSVNRNCLIVVNDDKTLIGTLTDGDIRRGFLKNISVNNKVEEICNKDYLYFRENYNIDKIKKILSNKNKNIRLIPILDNQGRIKKLFDISSFRKLKKKLVTKTKKLKVIIMAGGEGKRLQPATNILPKPLIPIGDKTLIEIIIKKFYDQGFKNFSISLNYKKELIKSYFKDIKNKIDYKLSFIEETNQLGTAGSLFYLKKERIKNFIVTNCDNILNFDYENLINYHNDKKNDLTIVGNKKKFNFSYGEIILDKENNFLKIKEKPIFNIFTNSGLYLINKNVINLLNKPKKIDMNELIGLSVKKGLKVGVFPVFDKSWIDVGQWNDYKKFLKSTNI